jgi:hypothetical protein
MALKRNQRDQRVHPCGLEALDRQLCRAGRRGSFAGLGGHGHHQWFHSDLLEIRKEVLRQRQLVSGAVSGEDPDLA